MKIEFVEEIPRELEQGTVYVSMTFSMVVHSCFCGCDHQVVTPLSPVDWKLTFDGEAISLYPSIGNWNLPCKSHYWIRNGHVIWAERWSEGQIKDGRRREAQDKEEYYRNKAPDSSQPKVTNENEAPLTGFWSRIISWFRRRGPR
jgi:hypothetical protein